jgi:hypothetical protein
VRAVVSDVMGDEIDELIDEVTVDAYGEDEQLWAFRQAFEDEGFFPFAGQVVGAEVQVESIDYAGDERRGLVAHCRRDRQLHTVSLLDVVPSPPVHRQTRRLLDAYRRWSGVEPLPPLQLVSVPTWQYPGFAGTGIAIPAPRLGLFPRGDWDPRNEYWGEPDEPLPALLVDVIDAGVRPSFEMEQVLPGVDDDDWDSDAIIEAMELHHAGPHRDAIRVLDDLLAIDRRCVDAWAHLGLIAFETGGPGPARELYEVGVAVAEESLPSGFNGVLPRGWIDNRPFLRCLHGLALCAWRQRRWDDTAAMFEARVWLDPSGSLDAIACLDQVRARQRWTRS